MVGNVIRPPDLFGDYAIGNGDGEEEQDDDRHNALDERGRDHRTGVRVTQRRGLRHHQSGDDGDKHQRGDPAHHQPPVLQWGQRCDFVFGAALPLRQPGLDKLVGEQRAGDGQHDHGGGHKVPVVDYANVNRAIHRFGGFGADAGKQYVGGDDQQVGGKAGGDAGDRRQQSGYRVAAHRHKHQRAKGRHHHQRGVRRDMAEEGDKQHHITGVAGADARGHFIHQRLQQADLFRQAGAYHQRQNSPQRRKAAEVMDDVGKYPLHARHAHQVIDLDELAGGRIFHRHVEPGKQRGGQHKHQDQIDEQ